MRGSRPIFSCRLEALFFDFQGFYGQRGFLRHLATLLPKIRLAEGSQFDYSTKLFQVDLPDKLLEIADSLDKMIGELDECDELYG